MKTEFSPQILEKQSDIKFHGTLQWEQSCSIRGRTDRHDEANSSFSQFYERAWNSSGYWHRKLSCTLHDSKNSIHFYLISIQNTADSCYKWSFCQAYLMSLYISLPYKISLIILCHLQFHTAKWKKTNVCSCCVDVHPRNS